MLNWQEGQVRLFTAYPTCQVQFQQKYPSTFEPSLAMLVAWLIADLMINPQIETYRLSCSFTYILVFFYYCVYRPLLTRYISTPKTPGNKTKFVVKLAHQPTNTIVARSFFQQWSKRSISQGLLTTMVPHWVPTGAWSRTRQKSNSYFESDLILI